MDALDRKILMALNENARMPLKELAARVALTSPAVGQRVRRMEQSGVIAGYTVMLDPEQTRGNIHAFVSMYVALKDREPLHQLVRQEPAVEECFHVTGSQSHMVKVSCGNIKALDSLISRLQKFGQTNTQIILSSVRGPGLALPE
jgi:Lrp/AsnC family leucine-responsive transcriptional regulator